MSTKILEAVFLQFPSGAAWGAGGAAILKTTQLVSVAAVGPYAIAMGLGCAASSLLHVEPTIDALMPPYESAEGKALRILVIAPLYTGACAGLGVGLMGLFNVAAPSFTSLFLAGAAFNVVTLACLITVAGVCKFIELCAGAGPDLGANVGHV